MKSLPKASRTQSYSTRFYCSNGHFQPELMTILTAVWSPRQMNVINGNVGLTRLLVQLRQKVSAENGKRLLLVKSKHIVSDLIPFVRNYHTSSVRYSQLTTNNASTNELCFLFKKLHSNKYRWQLTRVENIIIWLLTFLKTNKCNCRVYILQLLPVSKHKRIPKRRNNRFGTICIICSFYSTWESLKTRRISMSIRDVFTMFLCFYEMESGQILKIFFTIIISFQQQ